MVIIIRFLLLLLLGLLQLGFAMAQDTTQLTLSQCIKIAIKNNPELRRSELDLRRNELNYKQAQYNRLPSLNGYLNHGYNQGRSINSTTNQFVNNSYFSGSQSLSLRVPVFSGFQMLHDIRRKASAKEAGKLEFESATNSLKLDVVEAYILVLTSKDILTQAEGQLAVTQESYKRMESLQKEGAANPGDFYDLKGQLASEENIVQAARQSLYGYRVQLAGLMAIPVDSLSNLSALEFTDANSYATMELFERAISTLPQFKALDWRIKVAEQQVKVAKSAYFPTLSLDAGIQSRYSSADDAGFNYWQQLKNYPSKGLSLSLSIPIFNGFAARTQVRLAKVDLEDAVWQRKIEENTVRKQTSKNIFDLQVLDEMVKNLNEQEKDYEEAFRVARVHFEAGNSNSVLFLTAKNKFDTAQNQLLIKRYERLFQKYINDYYAGRLDL